MTTPCEQAENIGMIKGVLEGISKELERHGEREDQMIDALRSVAAQGEAIKDLARRQDVIDIREHERQIIDLKKPIAIRFWESKYGIYGLAAIACGLGLDMYCHYPIVKLVKEWIWK